MKFKAFLIAMWLIQVVLFEYEHSLWQREHENCLQLLRIVDTYQATGRVPCQYVALRRSR